MAASYYGLVSQQRSALEGGQTRLLRPRLIGYAGALVMMIGAFVWTLEARPTLSLDVTKDRTLYRENIEGQIENMYSLKVINKTQQPRDYLITLAKASTSCTARTRSVWPQARSSMCLSAWRSLTPMGTRTRSCTPRSLTRATRHAR